MSHKSPHQWVYYIPCCFGGVQSRLLGQTTTPPSGLFHPIVSPCALLFSIVKHPTLRNQSDLPHRWILALVLYLCILGKIHFSSLQHTCMYVKDSFI